MAAMVDVLVGTAVFVPARETVFVVSKIVYPLVGTLIFNVSNPSLIEGLG